MLVAGIKSKPVYAPLRADTRGRYHLMLASGSGATALLRVLAELEDSVPGSLHRTRVLYVPLPSTPTSTPGVLAPLDALRNTELGALRTYEYTDGLLHGLRTALQESLMGTRLYVAGPESFIGRIMQIALEFNLNKDEIRAEEQGSLARRVYCVHCRSTNEEVRTNIGRCGGCGRWLLVRDHYSRRFAAYMGVMVDAEAPGELPAVREVYP